MSKKKKKAKNSDYRYLQRKNDEWREEQERAEIKANKKKKNLVTWLAFLLVVGSVIAAVYSYTHNDNTLAPLYIFTSGIAMILMGWTSKETRPNFYKIGVGIGAAMLVFSYFIARQTGFLTGGFLDKYFN